MKNLLNFVHDLVGRQSRPTLPSLSDYSDWQGKKVLVRASLNVPLKAGKVADRYRLERAVPTIKYLQERGARVIVIGHIGREQTDSLASVHEALSQMIDVKWGSSFAAAHDLQDGEAIMLENLRQDSREKTNDDSLARELADLADVYVNDAFSDSHREHASIVGIPQFLPSYFGLNFIREFEGLSTALDPKHPALLIIGGAKFETKLPLIKRFLDNYDHIYVSGALANDIYKARGYEVGTSLISDVDIKSTGLLSDAKLMVPGHVLVSDGVTDTEVAADKVSAGQSIVDAGPTAIKEFQSLLSEAKTILWNGPLGNYEKGYNVATEELAKLIAQSDAYSIVGGGDTIASIHRLDLSDKFGFLSTAGGAMLTFLELGTLPGIDVVVNK